MEQKHRDNSDEIDLRQLFESLGNYISKVSKGIFNGFIKSIVGIRRITASNKNIIITSIFIFVVLAIVYKVVTPPIYESSMLIRSSYIDSRYLNNELEKLNNSRDNENISRLQQYLNITKGVADQIIEFGLVPYLSEEEMFSIRLTKEKLEDVEGISPELLESIIRYYEIENRRLFRISVKVKDPSVVEKIEEGFIQFLKGDAFISRRIEINKQTLLARKSKLVQESDKLDSLKIVLFENFASMAKQRDQGSNNVILSDRYLTNPLEVFSRDLDINEQILSIDRTLFLEPDFEVIDGFTAFYQPINPGWAKSLAYAIIAGIILAYLIIIFKAIDVYLDKIEREGIA